MKRLIIPSIFVSMALVLLIGISAADASTASTNRQRTPALHVARQRGASVNESPHSGYDLSWHTIAGGGATFSTGGSYLLGGAIGQPEAVGKVGNSPYTLDGGFWGGVSVANYDIYLPLVEVGG
jgi:hypothetical protein